MGIDQLIPNFQEEPFFVEVKEEEQKSLGKGVLKVNGGVMELQLEEQEMREMQEIMAGKDHQDRVEMIKYLEDMLKKGGKEKENQSNKKKTGSSRG